MIPRLRLPVHISPSLIPLSRANSRPYSVQFIPEMTLLVEIPLTERVQRKIFALPATIGFLARHRFDDIHCFAAETAPVYRVDEEGLDGEV